MLKSFLLRTFYVAVTACVAALIATAYLSANETLSEGQASKIGKYQIVVGSMSTRNDLSVFRLDTETGEIQWFHYTAGQWIKSNASFPLD